ncbi:MAG: serine--tRNA ligase [Parachlamydiales bacterium]|jgi:seryl-tRNA synthetase
MLDLKKLRSSPEEIEQKLKTKDSSIDLKAILELDEKVRNDQTEIDRLKARQNLASKEIGKKKENPAAIAALLKEMEELKKNLASLETDFKAVSEQRDQKLLELPNLPADGTPVSPDPKDNVCIKTWKEKRTFDFPFKNHLELNEKLRLFDFERASKISGANWPLYYNLGFRLEWALLNYMLDIHMQNGFIPIMPPLLLKEPIMEGCGQLPKFENQLYKIHDEDYKLYLLPTAEAAINGLHYDEIFEEESLPRYYVSYTPCFRREAGAAGKLERGLIRMHQFNKVELFAFTLPEESDKAFEKLLASAHEVLEGLEIHYRDMLLTTGDMSFAAAKTIDIEVYLPGQNRYYEVSSVSNCTDFQARRTKVRCKKKNDKPRLVHTLNGSGVATSRLMVALLENNQQADGSVAIPKVLHKYLKNEITVLKPKA